MLKDETPPINVSVLPTINSYRSGFIQQNRDSKVDELMRYPPAFMLVTQIARRARRSHSGLNPYSLSIGEAVVGDHGTIGLTEQQYRTAKSQLTKWGIATFRATNRGTIAKLVDASIYNINAEPANDPSNGQTANEQQASNKQPTTKKNVRSKETNNVRAGGAIRAIPNHHTKHNDLDEKVSDEAFYTRLRTENPDLDVAAEIIKAQAWLKKKDGSNTRLTREFLVRWMRKADRKTLAQPPKRRAVLSIPLPPPPPEESVAHVRAAAPEAFANIKAKLRGKPNDPN